MSLFHHGPVVADVSVPARAWAAAFSPKRHPLVLAPGSPVGWFGGLDLVGCDPTLRALPAVGDSEPYRLSSSIEVAGAALEEAVTALAPRLSAALLAYNGGGWAATFPRGLARSRAGWHAWGDWDGHGLPEPVLPDAPPRDTALVADAHSSLSREAYLGAVEAAREAMAAGDVYVLNLCRIISGRALVPPPQAFAALLDRTHASMAAYWDVPGGTLLSASPERFWRLERGLLTTHPVKGTRPRGVTASDERRLARELAACAKERAEHTMIVDLERNDLGRVCEPGSVVVAPLMRVETTPYCHQLVSAVGGTVRRETSLAEVLAATFPCGSITGAPKRSAMRLISRLEGVGRGDYTGSLVVAVPGGVDSSVLIRTAVAAGDTLTYGVGCGVTVDSDPAAEWEESETKAWPVLG